MESTATTIKATGLEARREAWERAREGTTVEDLEALIAHLVTLGDTVEKKILNLEAATWCTIDEWREAWGSVLDDGLHPWVNPDPYSDPISLSKDVNGSNAEQRADVYLVLAKLGGVFTQGERHFVRSGNLESVRLLTAGW